MSVNQALEAMRQSQIAKDQQDASSGAGAAMPVLNNALKGFSPSLPQHNIMNVANAVSSQANNSNGEAAVGGNKLAKKVLNVVGSKGKAMQVGGNAPDLSLASGGQGVQPPMTFDTENSFRQHFRPGDNIYAMQFQDAPINDAMQATPPLTSSSGGQGQSFEVAP